MENTKITIETNMIKFILSKYLNQNFLGIGADDYPKAARIFYEIQKRIIEEIKIEGEIRFKDIILQQKDSGGVK